MNLSAIRAQAREMRRTTPGFVFLFLLPILYTISIALHSFARGTSANQATIEEVIHSTVTGSLFPIVMSFVLTIFSTSISFTLIEVARRKKSQVSFQDSLRLFDKVYFSKAITTIILREVLLLLWSFLSILGSTIISIGATVIVALLEEQIYSGLSVENIPTDIKTQIAALFFLILLGLVLTIAGFALYIPQYYAYSQVDYILFEQLESGTYTGARQVIRQSRQMMKGYKANRLLLDISFWGWYLLNYFTLGFAGIYVTPYAAAAKALYYEALKAEHSK